MSELGVRRISHVDAVIRPRRGRRASKILALAVAVSTLVGCAGGSASPSFSLETVTSLFELDPVVGWEPPGWSAETDGVDAGVSVTVHRSGEVDPVTPDTGDANGSAGSLGSASSFGSGDSIGMMGGRIRNDAIGFAARYVQLPMRHRFNERMDELLWETIGATGGSFAPEVFPEAAGLNDRGCVPGSLTWAAERVLTEPATGPAGAVGTSLTCEVLEAYGNIIGVGVRVVTGNAAEAADAGGAEIEGAETEGAETEGAEAEGAEAKVGAAEISVDRVSNIYINVSDGTIHEGIPRWSAEAPAALWLSVVASLRRDAGGFSTGEIAAPTEEQVALVQAALDSARADATGGIELTVHPGITSPELIALGAEPTTTPVDIRVGAEIASSWVSPEMAAIHTDAAVPFVGLPSWNASLPVNCMLLACVAVTYDDGPSPMTPALLDTLWAQRAPVTFFMMGKAVSAAPATVARAASEGHEIGSHTVTHPELTKLPLQEAADQILNAAKTITGVTGVQVTSFRPPYGDINTEIIDKVKLPAILWSIDTNDWQLPGKPALLERSVGAARPGAIILFHDTHADTVDVANDVIVGLRNRGFALVTVTELFDGALPSGRVSSR